MKINDLIAEFGNAVSDAQYKIEMNNVKRFFDYFKPVEVAETVDADITESFEGNTSKKAGTKAFEPATVKIELPCSDDISRYAPVRVPLVTLVHHKQVGLNRVTIRAKVQLTRDEEGNIIADINAPVSRAQNLKEKISEAFKDDISEIELVVSASDSSEGISRVVQDISKII